MQAELGDDWDRLPESIRTRWVRALIDLRVARLLAYRAVWLQDDRRPARRPAPPHRDDHLRSAGRRAAVRRARPLGVGQRPVGALHGAVEDHWRYAQAATVASGTIEVQRMLVARETLGDHG